MISRKSNVIYVDCDGVMLNWLDGFFRWAYTFHQLKHKDGGSSYDLREHLDRTDSAITDYDFDRISTLFNMSGSYGQLAPYKDAIKYMHKIHEEFGYTFKVLTAVGDVSDFEDVRERRQCNIENVFGHSSMISDIMLVRESKDKKKILQHIFNEEQAIGNDIVFWVEDNVRAWADGKDIGFETFLLSAYYNKEVDAGRHRVSSWKDIYNHICEYGNI